MKTVYPEYNLIVAYYGEQRAARSGVLLMNHIDEGLCLLQAIDAKASAQRAYCLHPLLQSDEALLENFLKLEKLDNEVIILAMEYRSVANEYLSLRIISDIGEIRLSPIKEVNDMLIADKVQNRKDFELYHLGHHPRSQELSHYFNNWLERLGVSEQEYQRLIGLLL